MAAPQPSTLDIITQALKKLNIMGAGESTPSAEDTEFGLEEFNGIAEQLNLRKRNCGFIRQQAFVFTTSLETYSIGRSADSPNFVVDAGARPIKIEYAHLVLTDTSPYTELQVAVINVDQFTEIVVPTLSSQFPLTIYYQPTNPNGTIRPYPSFPTSTSYSLKLWWWEQFDTVALADIATALVLPQGWRRGLVTKLAIALYPSFPKRTDIDELRRQDREIWADITSVNVPPPKISSTDGIGSGPGTFDYRSRQFL